MSDVTITICFFLFVLAGVSGALLLFRRRAGESLATEQTSLSGGTESGLLRSMLLLGQIAPKAKGTGDTDPIRNRLLAAGYRDPSAPLIFNGIRLAGGLLCGVVLWWVGLLGQESASVGLLLAVCGFGMGYVFPDMLLQARSAKRIGELERALPNALDLMVLSVEAGQTLDAALMETSR